MPSVGMEVLHALGPADEGVADRVVGSSTTKRSGFRSSNGCARSARVVSRPTRDWAGPIPDASVAAASPRDIGAAAAAFRDIDFVVYHSGYERDPDGQEGPYVAGAAQSGVDRLVATLAEHGIGPGGNVYADSGRHGS